MFRKVLLTIAFIAASTVAAQAQIKLAWDASASVPAGCTPTYNIYRSIKSNTYTAADKLNSAPISGLTYTDSTAVKGTAYFYVSTAVCGSDESSFSNEVPVNYQQITLAAPAGLMNVCSNNGKTATISWFPVTNAVDYMLRIDDPRDNNFPGPQDEVIDHYKATSYSFTVAPGVLYSWWVRGFNPDAPDVGNGVGSGPITAAKFTCAQVNPPTNLRQVQ